MKTGAVEDLIKDYMIHYGVDFDYAKEMLQEDLDEATETKGE